MLSPKAQALNADTGSDTVWLKPQWFAALLALLVLVSFQHVILGVQLVREPRLHVAVDPETFVYRDFGYFGYPLAHHFRESIWRGELPLWNPLNNCGLPFLAQWNTQVLYPPVYFYVLFPLSWSLGVFCLLHLVLGGLGMFVLADRWVNHRLAAAIAGVAYAFSGLMFNSLMWPNNIAALGWLPWVVWLVERAWTEGGRTLLLAALAGAVQMLAGAPEVILQTWALLALLMVADLLRRDAPRAKILLRFCAVVILISGLAAAQLLPFLDLLTHSHRDPSFSSGLWSMPMTGWGNFLVPLFHCHPSFHGVFLQTGQLWTASYYVGVSTVALGLFAIWRVRDRRVWLLAGFALFCLVLALGDAGQLYRLLRERVAALGLMRYPIKFVVLPVFALPLLAAFAVKRQQANGRRTAAKLWLIWFVVTVLMLVTLWFAWKHPLADDRWDATWRNALARAAFFTAIFAALVFSKSIAAPKLRVLLQVALVVLVWLDLLTHAPRQQTVSRNIYVPNTARSLPAPRHGISRAMVSPAAAAELQHSYIPNPANDYLSRRWMLLWNCNLLDDIPVLDGFYSLYLPHEIDVGRILLGSTNAFAPRLMDFLGIALISSPTNLFDWTTRPSHLPLITGGQTAVFADALPTLERLAGADFNPQGEVYLPPDARRYISATNATRVRISNERFSADRIEFETEADAPAMVVAAQSFYHYWLAYVDGRPARLWRANHAFQTLEVPAGRHKVKLIYEDRRFSIGVIVSIVTLLGSAIAWTKMCGRTFGLGRRSVLAD